MLHENTLAATDLSARFDRAVQRALQLAAALKVPCHVISVVDDDVPDDMLARQKKDVEDRLARFVRSVARCGQTVTTAVIVGDPFATISEQTESADAGLVVLGLHRLRPFFAMVRDTTMERLARRPDRKGTPNRRPMRSGRRWMPA